VTKIGKIKQLEYQQQVKFKFIREKSEEGEFLLQITTGDQHSTHKTHKILIADIDSIEPIQGTRFELRYLKAQSYFGKQKSVKVESYDSKYLADILDCYE